MKKLLVSLFTILFFIGGFNLKAFAAEEIIDDQTLYNKAIQAGSLDQNEVSLEQWSEQNKEFKKIFNEGKQTGVLKGDISYSEWLKESNYGQFEREDAKTRVPRAIVGGFNIKAGDILITNGTSSAGIVGHAAIANGDNHILDIPGPGQTTRQLSTANWINEYKKKGWVKVYRLSNNSLARQAASWADRNYFSTSGSATQNIFPKYGIDYHLYSKNPTYCSKIVYQAYYYGTGSASVMIPSSGFVAPYGLIAKFDMKPSLVKTYN
ncbi:hypothetical protein [Bacillus toyonensis]|uniref:hypothetical protein n=1 Tax=Bacillus toyonensis TaxID=155322 RepID=UPI000B4346DA|nr:hypothetical protein [Bacillus toyonensis]MED3201269.1 hypothetical protein [Bacillus toyonensis]OTX05417.1 hypothetical protein BK712_17470 [Bacillus thuringiensis serovar seoulensis]